MYFPVDTFASFHYVSRYYVTLVHSFTAPAAMVAASVCVCVCAVAAPTTSKKMSAVEAVFIYFEICMAAIEKYKVGSMK